MHPYVLTRSIAGICQHTTTLEEFQSRSGIISKTVAKSVLEFLAINGIGSNLSTGIRFSESDRLKAVCYVFADGLR